MKNCRTRRSSEREPADPLTDKSNVIGGWLPTEWASSQGLSYSLIDRRLSAGVEMKFAHETERDSRSEPEIKFLVGPSVQWRPTKRSHLDLVPLIGATHAAPRVEAFLVFGIDLWPGSKAWEERYAPTSLKSK